MATIDFRSFPLAGSNRDEPIVEGSTIRLASRDPSLRLFTFGFFTPGEKPTPSVTDRDDSSSLKGAENRIVEGSMIRLAPQDPPFD